MKDRMYQASAQWFFFPGFYPSSNNITTANERLLEGLSLGMVSTIPFLSMDGLFLCQWTK